MTGPNGQAAHAALVAQWRDATRRLRAAATAANDLLMRSCRPGRGRAWPRRSMTWGDARDLSGTLVRLEHRRDNQNDEPKGQER